MTFLNRQESRKTGLEQFLIKETRPLAQQDRLEKLVYKLSEVASSVLQNKRINNFQVAAAAVTFWHFA